MSAHLQRALLLYGQSRYDLAVEEARQALADDPDDAGAHSILALCLANQKKYDEATAEAHAAIRLQPDNPHAHYTLALVLCERNRHKEALPAIQEALRFDPEDPDYHGLEAAIHLESKNWQAALESTERGLAFDAEHVQCNNLRAMALVKLGRKAEAGATIDAALARDPDNAVTHANQGWTLLEEGEPYKAMEHFREALRLDPNMEWARHGIIEAMKARSGVYRLMLRYFLWIQKLSGKAAWMFLIGLWLGNLIAIQVADAYPALAPYVWPLVGCYLAFVLMSWLAVPLFNLVLCTSRFGRLALSRGEIFFSALIGVTLALGLGCLATWALAEDAGIAFLSKHMGIMFVVLTIPFRGLSECSPGWPRVISIGYTIVMILSGALAVGIMLYILPTLPRGPILLINILDWSMAICLWGCVLSSWGINIIAGIIPKK